MVVWAYSLHDEGAGLSVVVSPAGLLGKCMVNISICAYHLKELLLSFQKIIKKDHQNSSYRANSSTLKMKGTLALNRASLNGQNFSSVCPITLMF